MIGAVSITLLVAAIVLAHCRAMRERRVFWTRAVWFNAAGLVLLTVLATAVSASRSKPTLHGQVEANVLEIARQLYREKQDGM